MSNLLKKEVDISLDLAHQAGKIQVQAIQRQKQLRIQRKNDDSPVTEVDVQCEELIRNTLLKHFPTDGFLGEESGRSVGTSGRCWMVDPLDGTRPFIRSIPTFSVLIALMEGDRPILGVIHLPLKNETYWASLNQGARLNQESIHVSKIAKLDTCMGTGFGFLDEEGTNNRSKRLLKVMQAWNYNYGFMDAYSYGCLAAGRLDCSINLLDKVWDCAAAACIIKEAGGRWSDLEGGQDLTRGGVIFSNGLVHDQLLAAFLKK